MIIEELITSKENKNLSLNKKEMKKTSLDEKEIKKYRELFFKKLEKILQKYS